MRKASAQGTMFAKTVADRAGISSSDMDCMDFLNVEGRMTAGRLAELTGLTSGAITGVIDRLERAGFVRRERDESDRRKVFIVPVPERVMEIGRLYEAMQRAMHKQSEGYSDAELKLLLRYATESYQSILGATNELKTMIEASPKAKPAAISKPRRDA
ncbi:MarR family transcriptional regulator [Bradyrhizobium sp.]|uniref:MarR family winged helix-turn-helix transcriptional regulator n=1 Tax=Bradyrhizobium sp. TaxID=376 RepID=UPI001D98D9E7|nr:MarR family transcriptional regulator [Bradyrhizobium sp.]MBV8701933.1 MarR family transcriptional regulator [Bradyrhizobium sp.]MBV9985626.1 MarR family transcriptional regulator [Bradyrhizobium sp.]